MHVSTQIKAFTYHGSKYSYLEWLLPLIDVQCNHFIDVFGGSAAVIINRAPAPIETFNDINGKVVNFFKVLREMPEELICALELTPHSKKEYEEAWFTDGDSDVEKARKFFIRTQQSIWAAGAQDKVKGWAASLKESRCNISDKTNKWLKTIAGLPEVVERFRRIQIENRDYRWIISKYDHDGAFFYLDSPYEHTFRSSSPYEFDFKNQDFFDLHYYAKSTKGKVAISGYNSPFMVEVFKDFNFNHGPQRKNTRSKKEACECLWTNY
jgi:DNA adenine methylase